jgi:hypothetical protein
MVLFDHTAGRASSLEKPSSSSFSLIWISRPLCFSVGILRGTAAATAKIPALSGLVMLVQLPKISKGFTEAGQPGICVARHLARARDTTLL